MAEARVCRDLLRRPEAKDGEYGGYGKKMILSDFKNCFTISDICDVALS